MISLIANEPGAGEVRHLRAGRLPQAIPQGTGLDSYQAGLIVHVASHSPALTNHLQNLLSSTQ